MLNIFEHGEAALSDNDPRAKLEEAWEQFFKHYRQNEKLLLECHDKRRYSHFRGEPPYEETDFEAEISHKAPALADSLVTIRRALDTLTGWHISWRDPERRRQWEVMDIPSETIPGILEPTAVRLPRHYDHDEGWIKGCFAGPDPTGDAPIKVLVEVANSPDTRGMYIDLDAMLHIELTPPQAAA